MTTYRHTNATVLTIASIVVGDADAQAALQALLLAAGLNHEAWLSRPRDELVLQYIPLYEFIDRTGLVIIQTADFRRRYSMSRYLFQHQLIGTTLPLRIHQRTGQVIAFGKAIKSSVK